ncbi:hypothetical protein CON65_17270 [Bacillus pseudomycoides]|uniref:Signal peptidase II n=1 Tax=Bacillus pseudomycoides TaxID=64104 RepID=A0AA91ZS77_9BACI|nr:MULTISPECIES: hypothetical protein [Bacillus]PEB54460.1 hypothetical protein COO03_05400 [Bacillus sp. AFS098217]PED81430.1 hypothetical protein CON65_17270 [Bacillus pseudomycoides]PEU06679.1 hypothetical protein CN524_22740 [Bacillus sp. AFS019443]PEU19131.1 hypothetical protein CN525_08360 [Bacillus sp. AFS014408]PFW63240.1 hypothetical protein COL20_09525 [Bacillus sp. AFS075034]
MKKYKWGSRVIFCLIAISACFVLAIGITKGAFFAKEKVLDSSNPKGNQGELLLSKGGKSIEKGRAGLWRKGEEKDSGSGVEIEDTIDFDKDGYYEKGKFKRIPRDNKLQNDGEEFTGINTGNIFIQIGILFLIILILFFIFRRIQNKKQPLHNIRSKQKEIQKIKGEEEQENRDSLILPVEEVRAMLIKWELTLPKFEKRRLQETVQQWFSRIHKSNDIIPIYEKVRYGEGTASNEELQIMRRWVKENANKGL